MRNEDERDVLHTARLIASFTILALIIFVVIIDRLGPVLAEDFVNLGDTALGLLLGALFALVGVQSIDFLRGK